MAGVGGATARLFFWLRREIEIKIKGVGLTASISPSACYLEKSKVAPSPSNQGCLLSVWPFVPQGSFTPAPLRGPCVRPAPKSRLAVSGPFVFEDQDQEQINGFPAEAGPTNCTRAFVGLALAGKRPVQAPVFFGTQRCFCGSELARECGIRFTRVAHGTVTPENATASPGDSMRPGRGSGRRSGRWAGVTAPRRRGVRAGFRLRCRTHGNDPGGAIPG